MRIKDRLRTVFGGAEDAKAGQKSPLERETALPEAGMMMPEMGAEASSEQPKQAIGKEEVAKAMELLHKYKSGKTNLEQNIIENQEWYRMRHWRQLKKDGEKDMPASAWLFNSIANKHADAMDNYPEGNVLPREEGDKGAAEELSAILPVIFERCHYKKTYSALWDDKLEGGTAVTGVFWDATALGGLGDIVVKAVDVLSLYWEPGVEDIQDSPNLFFVSLVNNDQLIEQYPFLAKSLGNGSTFTHARYIYDDNVDTSDKSEVVDWYYKKNVEGRTVLHFCKFVSGQVLYATENETEDVVGEDGRVIAEAPARVGLYAHGRYPFEFDPLFRRKGTPCGFGYVDVMKDCQMIIDSLDNSITTNGRMGSKRRFFMRKDSKINVEDYADFTKDFVEIEGSGDPKESVLPIEQPVLPPIYVNVLQNKIAELKETSGNRDFSQGGTTAGVTAASAIAALQEAGSKLSRDMITASYASFEQVCILVIELIRQFYDVKRSFRILGEGGAERFVEFDNTSIRPQKGVMPMGGQSERVPVFDVKVKAERQSPFSKISQNELAMELFGKGFFNPQIADQAALAVSMMSFEGKEDILHKISQNGTLLQQMEQMKGQMMMLGQMVESLKPGSGIVQSLAAQFGMQMPTMPMARGAEGGGSRVRVNSLGKPVAESEKVQRARENARQIVRK